MHQHLGVTSKYTAKSHSPTNTIPTTPKTIVSGHVDHGVRIVIRSSHQQKILMLLSAPEHEEAPGTHWALQEEPGET